MGFLSKITGFFGGLPWAQIGVVAALISGVIYGVHVIKLSGEQSQIIQQMEKDADAQHRQDTASIQALKDQYARDTQAIQKEKDDALSLARSVQEELDTIRNSKPADDGVTRPIISDTLKWMRDHNTRNGDTNPKDKSAHGVAYPNPQP